MFKKAISELRELEILALPWDMEPTLTDDSAGEWPLRLRQLGIGRFPDLSVPSAFEWPPALTGFTFDDSPNISERILEATLRGQEMLRTSLTSLHIRWDFPSYHEFHESTLLYQLPSLTFLRAPVEFMMWLLKYDPSSGSPAPSVRTLELTGAWGYKGDASKRMINRFFMRISDHLPNMQALGISSSMETAMRGLREAAGGELQARFVKNAENSSAGGGRRGLYKIDEPPSLFTEDM